MTGNIQPVSGRGQETEPASDGRGQEAEPAGVSSAGKTPTSDSPISRAICAMPHACKDDLKNLPSDSWHDVGGVPLVSDWFKSPMHEEEWRKKYIF